jgi:hypothetical protein
MPKWTDRGVDTVDALPLFRNWSSGTGPMYGRLARALREAI